MILFSRIVQYSRLPKVSDRLVFQCRLSGRHRAELAAWLEALISHAEDHVVILDLGPAEKIALSPPMPTSRVRGD